MKAVVTGATGAIGMALIELLEKNKIKTLVLCRKDSPRSLRIKENDYIKKVDCPLSEMKNFHSQEKYDIFFHFAWDGTFGENRNNLYLQNDNVRYTLDAVNLASRLGCNTFIGAGSHAEYGRCEGDIAPNTPANPETGYGIAKLCAGLLSREEAQRLSIKHIWVRILSVYGSYDTERTMVMSTIKKLMQGEVPEFTPAEQMWDYLYSKDAAKAFLALAEHGKSGEVYCLGSGESHPLKEYILKIRDEVDSEGKLDIGKIPYAAKQPMYLKADITKLNAHTGFTPSYTFEEGIAETVLWAKEEFLDISKKGEAKN